MTALGLWDEWIGTFDERPSVIRRASRSQWEAQQRG
jgi:hypothetical protein